MLFLLDSDKEGQKEQARYVKEFGLDNDRIATLSELLEGTLEIEDLLDEEALGITSQKLKLSNRPSKNQIRRYFQEHLASDNMLPLGAYFESRATSLLGELTSRLAN